MDFLITTLSLINPKNFKEGEYAYPERIREKGGRIVYKTSTEERITGYFTNEAPTKYLLNRKWEETYTFFDKVIILGTKECDVNNIREMFKEAEKKKYDRRALSDKEENEIEKAAEKYPDCTTREYYEGMILKHIRQLMTEKTQAGMSEAAETVKKYNDSSFFSFINVDDLDYGQILTEIQKLLSEAEDEKAFFTWTIPEGHGSLP